MPNLTADRVKETTTTTGTGTVTLAGAVAQFRSFASAFADGSVVQYAIVGQTGTEWEVGNGTLGASGTTLARTTVLASSNANAAVNFSAGTKDVFATVTAAHLLASVLGPASATDSAVAVYDGVTGRLVKNSFLLVTADGAIYTSGAVGKAVLVGSDGMADTGGTWAMQYGNAFANRFSRIITWQDGDSGYSGGTTAIVVGVEDYGSAVGKFALHANTSPTRLRIYGTRGDGGASHAPTDYERLSLSANGAGLVTIAAETAGTGSDNVDLALSPAGAGSVQVKSSANGNSTNLKTSETTVTLSGPTTTAAALFPAKCIRLGVSYRVTTLVTSGDGGTSFNVGDGTDADLYGATKAFAAGTTGNLTDATADPTVWNAAAGDIVFTCVGGTFSGGVVRVVAHYIDLTAPTS